MKNYVILSLCLMFFVFNANAKNVSRSSQNGSDSTFIDYLHPRNFIRIYELDTKGKIHYISLPSNDLNTEKGSMSKNIKKNIEVDIDSRICIEIDREELLKIANKNKFFEGNILVTGNINGRKIEVPGYSMVGQPENTVSVKLRSGRKMFTLLLHLDNLSMEMYNYWYQAAIQGENEYLANCEQNNNKSDNLKEIEETLKRIHADSKSINDSVFYEYWDQISDLRKSNEYYENIGKYVIKYLKPFLIQKAKRLSSIINEICKEDNYYSIEVLSRILAVDARVYIVSANELNEKLVPDMLKLYKADTVNEKEIYLYFDTWKNIYSEIEFLIQYNSILQAVEERSDVDGWGVGSINTNYKNYLSKDVNCDFVSFLKDTDFLVKETGAKINEDISLTIFNCRDKPEISRSYTVSMKVKKFGLVQNTHDSFLFIHRNDVSKADYDLMLEAKIDEVTASGESSKITIQRPSLFEPAPGATFGWVWKPRGEKTITKIFKWLEPGFGINVSTPTFRNTEYTIEANGVDSEPTIDIIESDNNIQFGVGVMASIWDGAVQFTYGKNMSYADKNEYYGLGFSFINVIKKVKIVMTKD